MPNYPKGKIPLNKQPDTDEDLCSGTAIELCGGTGPIETIEEYRALTDVLLERHRVWGRFKPDPLGDLKRTIRNGLEDIIVVDRPPSDRWLWGYFNVYLRIEVSISYIRKVRPQVWDPNDYQGSDAGAERKGRKPKPR